MNAALLTLILSLSIFPPAFAFAGAQAGSNSEGPAQDDEDLAACGRLEDSELESSVSELKKAKKVANQAVSKSSLSNDNLAANMGASQSLTHSSRSNSDGMAAQSVSTHGSAMNASKDSGIAQSGIGDYGRKVKKSADLLKIRAQTMQQEEARQPGSHSSKIKDLRACAMGLKRSGQGAKDLQAQEINARNSTAAKLIGQMNPNNPQPNYAPAERQPNYAPAERQMNRLPVGQ